MTLIADGHLTRALGLHPIYADPVVKWAGGKRGLRQKLLSLMPAHIGTYFEPFLGGAALFLASAPANAVLNDANHELMELYRAIREGPRALMSELDAMQPRVLDAQFFYEMRSTAPIELARTRRAARFIYLNKTCYNGLYRVNAAGQFNVPIGRYSRPPALYNADNLLRVSDILTRADLKSCDFVSALATAGKEDFVYLDPPYVPLSATASFTQYTSDSFGEDDQRRLALTVRDLTVRGCRVLLSNSDTPLVRELYSSYEWDVVYVPRSINSEAERRQKIAELAIRNYSET